MKRIIVIAFMLMFSYTAQSQVLIALLLGDKLNTGKIEFGLEGGVNFSNISGMEANGFHRKWNLGFYFDIKMKEQWYLSTGVLVKADLGIDRLTENDLEFLGANIYPEEGEYSQVTRNFIVPALVKYKFKNNMYVELGPQFGLMHDAFILFESEEDGIEIKAKETNKDMIQKLDMGITAGTGYRLLKGLGWTVGVRYYYGFIDVYKDRSGTKNSSLFLRLNVPFGISQEKKDDIKAMKTSNKEKKTEKKETKKAAKELEKSNDQ